MWHESRNSATISTFLGLTDQCRHKFLAKRLVAGILWSVNSLSLFFLYSLGQQKSLRVWPKQKKKEWKMRLPLPRPHFPETVATVTCAKRSFSPGQQKHKDLAWKRKMKVTVARERLERLDASAHALFFLSLSFPGQVSDACARLARKTKKKKRRNGRHSISDSEESREAVEIECCARFLSLQPKVDFSFLYWPLLVSLWDKGQKKRK